MPLQEMEVSFSATRQPLGFFAARPKTRSKSATTKATSGVKSFYFAPANNHFCLGKTGGTFLAGM